MKPIVTTTGKLAQLRYELPHRLYDAKVYPVKAPNGSTILLYGHESGVGILWRGGRPLKKSAPAQRAPSKVPPPKVNGTSSDAIMIIDSDDDEPAKTAPQPPPEAEFEDDDEELDPDLPYPSFVQQLRLALNTQVVHIAVPHIPAVSALRPADTVPEIFSKKIVFAVACADHSVRVISLPLTPPSEAAKESPLSAKSQWGEEVVRVPTHVGHQSIPRGITMTWTSRAEPSFDERSEDEMEVDGDEDAEATPGRRKSRRKQSRSRSARRHGSQGWDLLVASHSAEVGGLLKIWRFEVAETSVTARSPFTAYQALTLRTPATKIAFNSAQYPKRRHSQLLITDISGIARIYDTFAPPSRKRRAGADPEPGGYVALFRTTFEPSQSNILNPPVLAKRKSIIDAAWASDGQSIVTLLADGEWGIWDVGRTGPRPPSDPSAFSIRGFLPASEADRSESSGASSPKKRNSGNSLVPMTPNTRRKKEESLFQGTSSSSAIPSRGGIAIASLPPSNGGTPEDSMIVWYGADVYRIPNLEQFWSRIASGATSSLSKPAISKIHGLSLFGEAITFVDQFDTTAKEARMAIPRDVLISTDRRLIITTSATRPFARDLNAAFEKDEAEEEQARRADQALLAEGELDLGGMDRLLEDMEGSGSGGRSLVLGNPRKVLFASSTS